MSKDIPEILKQIDRRDGMTVPEGYFDDFAARMASSLPRQPWEDAAATPEARTAVRRMTRWQRVRPYVYMAAMFAGIWCMFKMFSLMSGAPADAIDSNPVLSDAVADEDFVNEQFVSDLNEFDIYDSMIDDSIGAQDINADSLLEADSEYVLPTVDNTTDEDDIPVGAGRPING